MNKNTGASKAANIALGLMSESEQIGLPALGAATRYATTAVDRGLPAFAERGYRAASTAALEQAVSQENAARVATMTGKMSPSAIANYTGAAGALAKERSGIAVSRAAAGVSQRNQMLNILAGGGASATQLGTSFGQLTNRGLAAGLNAGNPTYEGIVGGAAAVSPLLLQLLQQKNPIQQSNLAYSTGSQIDIARNIARVPIMG